MLRLGSPHIESVTSVTTETRSLSQEDCLEAHGVSTGLLTFGIGGWAATMQLAGAVVAPGILVVDTSLKKVQHPTGGVIAELNVRDGSEVKAGDTLVRLDDTITRANLAVVTKSMDELTARQLNVRGKNDRQFRI